MTARPSLLRDPVLLAAAAGAIAAAAWIAWLAGLAHAGCWGAAPHGDCSRVDFSAFWGAGRLADSGHAADAYSWPRLRAELESAWRVTGIDPLPFLYPPPMLLATAGLGAFPYPTAFAVWTVLGLAAYATATHAVLGRPAAWMVAAAPAGAFYCAFAGQNGFLTASALAAGLLCLDRRPLTAGAFLALFACKPQLALLAPVALVAAGRWRVLASMSTTYALLCGAAALAFGPQVLSAFITGAAGGGGAFAGGGWVPWWKVQSLYGALRGDGLAAGPSLACQGLLALAAAAAVWTLWRSEARSALKAAGLAAAALVAGPYGFVYEGPLLAVAALFLLRDTGPDRPLTMAQGALFAAGLFGQEAFLVTPASLVTPAAAGALLVCATLRARAGVVETARVDCSVAGPAPNVFAA